MSAKKYEKNVTGEGFQLLFLLSFAKLRREGAL